MANARRRHRRSDKPDKSKGASKQRREAPAAPAGPTSVHDVPDHLLELILLRLHSSACLLRAAAACKRWRGLVAGDAGFISRFRSFRRAPPVAAGYYHTSDPFYYARPPPIGGGPTFVPSVPVDRGRFSLDFLPDRDPSWELADSRGSLLLLSRKRLDGWHGARLFPDLVVCEPLTRRHQGVLRPVNRSSRPCIGVFLLDGGSMSSFRVVAVLCLYDDDDDNHPWADGHGKPLACVFTSGSDGGGWRTAASAGSGGADDIALPRTTDLVSFVGRANGALHWEIGDVGAVLALDEATATTFSLVPLPDKAWGPYGRWCLRVVGGGGEDGGALRVVRLVSNELSVFVRLQRSSGGGGWVLEKQVRLPEATRGLPGRDGRFFRREAMIVDAHDAYVLVTPQEETWLFSVELGTMELERAHERNRYPGAAYPCELPWPPALEACAAADHGRRRRR